MMHLTYGNSSRTHNTAPGHAAHLYVAERCGRAWRAAASNGAHVARAARARPPGANALQSTGNTRVRCPCTRTTRSHSAARMHACIRACACVTVCADSRALAHEVCVHPHTVWTRARAHRAHCGRRSDAAEV